LISIKHFLSAVYVTTRKHPYIVSAILIFIGIIYLYVSAISVLQIEENDRDIGNYYQSRSEVNSLHTFTASIESKIVQSVLLNIVAKDEIRHVAINGNPVSPLLQYKEGRTSHKNAQFGDVYKLYLTKGINVITVTSLNKQENYSIAIAQHRSISEYLFLSLTIILPLCLAALKGFEFMVQNRKRIFKVTKNIPIIAYIIAAAILLRLFYFSSIGYIQFQHDYHEHIDFIKFFAENFALPLPHKGWEFPQQPLYYIISGIIYSLGTQLRFQENQILFFISGLSCVLSSVALIYAYRLVRRLTSNTFVHYLTVGFLAFTPSLIYMSTRINNDSMTASLAVIALFYIVASYQNKFQKYFIPALLFSALALLTKLSAITIWLLFFILLIPCYFKTPVKLRSRLFHYSWLGIFLLGFILLKSYSFAAGEFVLINSGIWPGQDLRPLDANYFLSFNFSELLSRAHAFWADKETTLISRSFFTYQYGTMLFGEFDYSYWKGMDRHLTITMQIIIILAILIPAGLLVTIFRKKSFIEICLLLMVVANVALIIKFIFEYPSTSATDFRYYAPSLFPIGYLMATGLDNIASRHVIIRNTLYWSASVLFSIQALFIVSLAT